MPEVVRRQKRILLLMSKIKFRELVSPNDVLTEGLSDIYGGGF